jgi:hypothetical protein
MPASMFGQDRIVRPLIGQALGELRRTGPQPGDGGNPIRIVGRRSAGCDDRPDAPERSSATLTDDDGHDEGDRQAEGDEEPGIHGSSIA